MRRTTTTTCPSCRSSGLPTCRPWASAPTARARLPAAVSGRYGVFVTPTLLFLDADGLEVSKRIVGINSVDFFGAYVDEALAEGRKRIEIQQSARNP